METIKSRATLWQISPFFCFVGIFLISALFLNSQISPLFACLVAIAYSFFTFIQTMPFNKKIELFLQGAAQETVLAMCFIFIFSAAFTHVLKLIGGVDAAVAVGMSIIPIHWILPGLFVIISLFATAIGSSMGTIAAFMPIALSIGSKLSFDPALMAGVVVSGAMLGDNVSLISDTTIAATQTIGVKMRDKLRANIALVIPAFLCTIATLAYINARHTFPIASMTDSVAMPITAIQLLKIVPYAMIFVFAMLGIDVIATLIIGIFSAIVIGLWLDYFSVLRGLSLFFEGFLHDSGGMQEVLVLVLLVSGLAYIVEYNGGLTYLLEKMTRKIRNKKQAELSISALVFLINSVIAVNTIAILITGPLAKKIGTAFNISGKRMACLLDIVSCICQGILPYAQQLVLAASLASITSVAIIPYLYYQGFIAIVLMFSIFFPRFVLFNV